jgi:DNA repair protein RecO (recombination protein O)
VLKLTKLTDTSLIVTWFTEGFGKLKTVAKGARRPKSPFLGKLDLFYLDDIVVVHSRSSELHILKECALIDAHPRLRQDFSATAAAAYLCELTDLTTEVETPVPKLFEALRSGLKAVEHQAEASVRQFEMRLFDALGHAPRLVECAKCGTALTGDVCFAARAGGGFCQRCAVGVSPKFKVDAETLRALHELSKGAVAEVSLSAAQRRQSDQVTAAMLKEVFGVWPKSRQFL